MDGMYAGEKIDLFCHIIPPKFKEMLFGRAGRKSYYLQTIARLPALTDLDLRFRAMDLYEGLRQVLDLGAPPVEHLLSPEDAAEAARIANDEMAELVDKYPDRFVGFVAGLPMNDVDAALRETDRAVKELKCKGVQLFTSINGKPLDRPEFLPLYEKLAAYDLPVWIHPVRDNDRGDYAGEPSPKYSLFNNFGWPYETTLAMGRLVGSGVMEKFPTLAFIAHHCGAMLPFFWCRVGHTRKAAQPGEVAELSKPPLDYFKKFYGDTVLGANTPALMCGYAFFGADHMVFASDYPYPGGAQHGDTAVGEVIEAIDLMTIPPSEKAKIFSGNAGRLLKLS